VEALPKKRLWCAYPNPQQRHFCPDGHPFGASRGCKASDEPFPHAGHGMGGWCKGHAPVNIQLADQALRSYEDTANKLMSIDKDPYDYSRRGPNYTRAQLAYIQHHQGVFMDYSLVENQRPHTEENRKQPSYKPNRRQKGLAYSQVTSEQAAPHHESRHGEWHQPRGHGKTGGRRQGNHSRSSSVSSRSGSPHTSRCAMPPPPPPAGYEAVQQQPPLPPVEAQPALFSQIETVMDRRFQAFMESVFSRLPVNNGINNSSSEAEIINVSNGRSIENAVINIQPISTVGGSLSGSATEATVMPPPSSDVEMDGN